jgi:hypothetical protein
MAGVKRPTGGKPTAKKPAKPAAKKPRKKPAPDVRIDPFTGQPFPLILHRLPGKGKIDPKVIRAAVIKVRDERLARERAAAEAGRTPE